MKEKNEISIGWLNVEYALVQACYWAMVCALGGGYGTVFLLDKGFTSTQAGIAIAISNTIGVLLQPVLASIVDSSKTITLHRLMRTMAIVILVGYIATALVRSPLMALGFIFVMTLSIILTLQSFTNALSLYYINRGVMMNYGLPRGMGSVSYAIISVIIGELLKTKGTDILPIIGSAYTLVIILVLLLMPVIKEDTLQEKAETTEKKTIIDFFKKYPIFMLFILGVTLIFVFHGMCNTYLVKIMENVGGNESQMGFSQSIAAIVELPVMATSALLMKKFKTKHLLIFSAVMFVCKAIGYYAAGSVMGVHLTQGFQMFSYAVFIPVSVFFVNEIMDEGDMVKGQALVVAAITVGGVISSLMGGAIIDGFGVVALEIVQIVFAVVGAIILIISACMEHSSVI